MDESDASYHTEIATIRSLLSNAFTEAALRRLCEEEQNLRPVLPDLGSHSSLNEMVDVVINYCRINLLLPELLAAVEKANPRQFERFRNQLGIAVKAVSQAENRRVSCVLQNLPPRYGDFLGREPDIARVLKGLDSHWPVVSIEGLAGVGKTTLAIEAASRSCLHDQDEISTKAFEAVVWVSAKDRPSQQQWLNDVLDTVARVFNFPYIAQMELDDRKLGKVDHLLRAHRILIVVDNFETIADPELSTWIRDIPEPSKVLITSRRSPLRSAWAVSLRGLEESDALKLIRCHAQRLGLQAVESASDGVLQPLSEVTDGNPKAIELALGYLKYGTLTLTEVVDHLHSASREVEGVFDDLYAWTWRLLSEDAQKLLVVMSLFEDTTTKEALGAVANLGSFRLDRALEQVIELSLFEVAHELGALPRRFGLHPLTRAFAGAKAQEAGVLIGDARGRQVQYFEELVQQCGGTTENWRQFNTLDAERRNLLDIMDWCFREGRWQSVIDLQNQLWSYWELRGYWAEQVTWCTRAIEACSHVAADERLGRSNQPKHGTFHLALCWVILNRGDLESAEFHAHRAMEILEPVKYEHGLATACRHLGLIAHLRGQNDESERLYELALGKWRQLDDKREMSSIFNNMGSLRRDQGEWGEARRLLEQALSIRRTLGDASRIATTLFHLGRLEELEKSWQDATNHYSEAVDAALLVGDKRNAARSSLGNARVSLELSDFPRAMQWAVDAHKFFSSIGMGDLAEQADTIIRQVQVGMTS